MRQDHYDNTKALLDRWADEKSKRGMVGQGAPKECLGAPDARIHSFEDLEIEDNKHVVRAVESAVWELAVLERNAVLMHYGFMAVRVWRADFDTMFNLAIESLHKALKNRVAC